VAHEYQNQFGGITVKNVFYACIFTLLLLGASIQASADEPISNPKLVNSWKMTINATDKTGTPCPFTPEVFDFYSDQTVVLSNSDGQHLPYKITVTPEEREIIEKRVPEFKGKKLLLIKPNPNMEWTSTPMIYVYAFRGDSFLITLPGFSSAKYKLIKK
jgi:hypothetical protein